MVKHLFIGLKSGSVSAGSSVTLSYTYTADLTLHKMMITHADGTAAPEAEIFAQIGKATLINKAPAVPFSADWSKVPELDETQPAHIQLVITITNTSSTAQSYLVSLHYIRKAEEAV
ncbi:MAG: hypothetical protein QXG08_07980 [Candidatus Methanomethyliaceae archaeon]